MNYKDLDIETWKLVGLSGDLVSGYRTKVLTGNDSGDNTFHLFCDEKGFFHFAIETTEKFIEDPLVNGLKVNIQGYRLEDGNIKQMIDLCCNIKGYLEEFTGVVKEILVAIIERKENPTNAVTRILGNWKAFWAGQNRQMLSEDEMLGLLGELLVFYELCKINAANALASWTGPLKGRNDFNFTSWVLEIKATRHSQLIHTINGLDQLEAISNKSLGLISFYVNVADNNNSISLPVLIDQIIKECFNTRLDLAIRFNELLAGAGYNPTFIDIYRNFKIEISQSTFYVVDKRFPRLIQEDLIAPLNNRISKLRYDISLMGLPGVKLSEISWGDYFY
jgi:hypothetical protein